MGLPEALREFNELKEKETIQDYAIGGGYAVIYHKIPYSSYDLDIFVIIGSDEDFHAIYQHFRERGNKIEDVYIFIEGMPVQILPNISPLHTEAVEQAHETDIEGVPTKVARIEHLIALALEVFRGKDKIRIRQLSDRADKELLGDILDRFDNEQGILRKRYTSILAGT